MENLKISATPQPYTKTFDLNDYTISQIYSGQLNSCRCGCNGRYFEDTETKTINTKLRKLTKHQQAGGTILYDSYTDIEGSETLQIEMETSSNGENKRGLTFYFIKK